VGAGTVAGGSDVEAAGMSGITVAFAVMTALFYRERELRIAFPNVPFNFLVSLPLRVLCLRFSENGKSNSRSYIVYREHGKGGAAPVTKGTINIQRLHTTFVADLYWLGHSHTDIVDKTPWTIYPDRNGNIIRKQKRSVITAGYQGCFEQRDLKKDNDYYRASFPEEKFLIPSGQGSALLHIATSRSHSDLLQAEITS